VDLLERFAPSPRRHDVEQRQQPLPVELVLAVRQQGVEPLEQRAEPRGIAVRPSDLATEKSARGVRRAPSASMTMPDELSPTPSIVTISALSNPDGA
jgi:hypothetical protein